jgi:hypothetical protein
MPATTLFTEDTMSQLSRNTTMYHTVCVGMLALCDTCLASIPLDASPSDQRRSTVLTEIDAHVECSASSIMNTNHVQSVTPKEDGVADFTNDRFVLIRTGNESESAGATQPEEKFHALLMGHIRIGSGTAIVFKHDPLLNTLHADLGSNPIYQTYFSTRFGREIYHTSSLIQLHEHWKSSILLL